MTEAEAKTKWCHRTMLPQPADWSRCVGSDCMAWRWNTDRDPALETIEWDGFCGLAGVDHKDNLVC